MVLGLLPGNSLRCVCTRGHKVKVNAEEIHLDRRPRCPKCRELLPASLRKQAAKKAIAARWEKSV